MLYLHFFHGRKTVDEEMNDWGEIGPIVETAFVSWTYGNLKLHDGEDDFIFLNETEGLIPIGNMYYGDFELLDADNTFLKGKTPVSLHDFELLNRQPENKQSIF